MALWDGVRICISEKEFAIIQPKLQISQSPVTSHQSPVTSRQSHLSFLYFSVIMEKDIRSAYYIRTLKNRGNFEVLDSEKRSWAYLNFHSWLSPRATGEVKGKHLEIKSRNIFNSKFDIFLEGEDVGDIVFNWKMQMIIRLLDYHGQERQYLLRIKGIFNQRFVLQDDIKNPILEMAPRFRWATLRYDYKVFPKETQYLQSPIELMLAISAYAANLYKTRKGAAAGGA